MKNNMGRVGILYICTGEYFKFWNEFYQSSEKYLLNNEDLHYFIFTDNEDLLNIQDSNIHPIWQDNLSWPYPTLYRFKFFFEQQEILQQMDYLIFCNANLFFKRSVNLNDLLSDKPMFATAHPGYYNRKKENLPYEKNKKSLAFIDKDNFESQYVCGGFNGGKSEYFLNMARKLHHNIESDLKNNIVAIWHDESHFNRYFNDNKNIFSILPPIFCWPENKISHENVFITVQDKHKAMSVIHKGLFYTIKSYVWSLVYKLRIFLSRGAG